MKIFPDLKIINKAREIYERVIGSNPAQSDRRSNFVFDIGKRDVTVGGATDINQQSLANNRMVRREMEQSPGAIGSADPAPWQHNLNRDYVRPQENYRRDIAADVATAINPQLRAAERNIAYGAAATFQGFKVLSAPRIKRVQQCLNQFVNRTRLKLYLPEYVRRYFHYGRQYLQHELMRLDGKVVIKQLLYMPTYGMIRCSNDLNQFDDLDHAYEQQDVSKGVYRKLEAVGFFPEWSINNLLLYAVPGEPDGHSGIESAIYSGANERFIDAMVELFWQHKYSRPVDIHSISGPTSAGDSFPATKTQIDEHLDRVAKARQTGNGKEPPRDIVTSGTVTRLPGDPNVDKVAGLQMMCTQVLAELWQSASMLSDDTFANVGVLVERFRQKFGAEEQIMVGYGTQLKDTVDFELGLNGFDPKSIEYEAIYGQQMLIQDLIAVNSQARADRSARQIPLSTRLKIASQLYRDNPARMQEELEKEEEANAQKLIDQQEKLKLTAGDPLNPTEKNPDTTDRQPSDPAINADSDSKFTN